MFFKKKGLPALEKRLIDASAKIEHLEADKEKILADILLAQDEGKDIDGFQKQLVNVKDRRELCQREIELTKQDIIEHHRLELEKDLAAFPAREAAYRERLKDLAAEGRKALQRAKEIFSALGGEYAPEGLSGLDRTRLKNSDLLDFIRERSELTQLRGLHGRPDRDFVNQRVARNANRLGIRILPRRKKR
jgi:hypothetical protein